MHLLFVLSRSCVSESLDCEVVRRSGCPGEGITGRETVLDTPTFLGFLSFCPALLGPGREASEDARSSKVLLLGEEIKGVSGDDTSGCATLVGFAVGLGVDVSS